MGLFITPDGRLLIKSVPGSMRPGHKYVSRKPKAGGGYEYIYREPVSSKDIKVEEDKKGDETKTIKNVLQRRGIQATVTETKIKGEGTRLHIFVPSSYGNRKKEIYKIVKEATTRRSDLITLHFVDTKKRVKRPLEAKERERPFFG